MKREEKLSKFTHHKTCFENLPGGGKFLLCLGFANILKPRQLARMGQICIRRSLPSSFLCHAVSF